MEPSTKKWLALAGLGLASFLTAIDFAIVNTALPAIQKELSANFVQLQWIMNIYVLVVCTLLVTMGRLGDMIGRKLLLNIGVFIFGLTSLFCGIVSDPLWLIIGRALQGIGSAIIIPCSLAIVTQLFQGKEQATALGIWTSINGIGFALGPVLGGVLVNFLSWRWVFFINIPVFIPSLLICITMLTSENIENKNSTQIDWLGFLSFTVGIATLVTTIIQGFNTILLSISILSLIALGIIENRVRSPMIKFRLLLNKTFLSGVLANFCIVTFAYVAFFFMPLYLDTIRHENSNQLGLMLLPITLTMTIISPFIGKWVDKKGAKIPMLLGIFFAVICAMIQANFSITTSPFIVLTAFIFLGLAWGFIWGSATHTAISALPASDSGLAAGALWTIQNLGGAVGLAIAGMLFRLFGNTNFLDGYAAVMWFLAGLSSLILLAVLIIYPRNS